MENPYISMYKKVIEQTAEFSIEIPYWFIHMSMQVTKKCSDDRLENYDAVIKKDLSNI